MNNQGNIVVAALGAAVAGWAVWKLISKIGEKPKTENNTTMSNNANTSNQDLTLGYRNNNPLNIRYYAKNNWLGRLIPNTDGVYEQFIEMPYGYRAAAFLLRKYITEQGLNTIDLIVNKWAPEGDGKNNPDAYAKSVSMTTGYSRSKVLTATAKEIKDLLYAMAIVENGRNPLPNKNDIDLGYKLL